MENETVSSQDEPQKGGSYTRNPDGALIRREWTKEKGEQMEEGTEEQPQQ